MVEKLEKIIKLSLNQGKDWEEIEQLVSKKSIILGISSEDCKLILEKNKPLPQEELVEEPSNKKTLKIELDYGNVLELYKTLIFFGSQFTTFKISYFTVCETVVITEHLFIGNHIQNSQNIIFFNPLNL